MQAKTSPGVNQPRRALLRITASSAALAVAGCAAQSAGGAPQAPSGDGESQEAEVTPGEDLMQEHGVIERILLVYDEAARRIEETQPLELAVLPASASIVRRFVEDYHERQEERFVFPRMQKAGRETDLVGVLLLQHERGRQLTDDIATRSRAAATPELARALRSFARMYRPHAAREDTVLFPAFREVVGGAGYRELGEQFEENEHRLFGEHGFADIVAEVAKLEAALGIANLADFTAPPG